MKKILVLALALSSFAPAAQAFELPYGCARAIRYTCYMPSGEMGQLRLNEQQSTLDAIDRVNSLRVKAMVADEAGNPLLHVIVHDPAVPGQELGSASAQYGTNWIALSVTGRRGPAQYSCAFDQEGLNADGTRIVSRQMPPAPRPEHVAPKPGFVWSAGYWVNLNGRWDWKAGFWMRQRAGYRSYEQAEWFRCDGLWRLAEARWVR